MVFRAKNVSLKIIALVLVSALGVLFFQGTTRAEKSIDQLLPAGFPLPSIAEGETLAGTLEALVLTINTGSNTDPQFTEAVFYGDDTTTLPIYHLTATKTYLVQPGWWRIVYKIPADVSLAQRWIFSFINPQNGAWLSNSRVVIDSDMIVTYEGAFAFSECMAGNCSSYFGEEILTGYARQVELHLYTGSTTEAQYTKMYLFTPEWGQYLPIYKLAATGLENLGEGWWNITYEIPTEAQVAERWRFGFVDPNTGAWLSVDRVKIDTDKVMIYENAFAFTELKTTNPADIQKLLGTTSQITLKALTGSNYDPRFTDVYFFGPDGVALSIHKVSATSTTLLSDGFWQIDFTVPAEANITERWRFNFVDPANGEWFNASKVTIESDAISLYSNAFAFTAYKN